MVWEDGGGDPASYPIFRLEPTRPGPAGRVAKLRDMRQAAVCHVGASRQRDLLRHVPLSVTPAKAGVHTKGTGWIPAFARVTQSVAETPFQSVFPYAA